MKLKSYLSCGLATTLNIVLNALTGGNFLWLEGRVRGGRFRNWARNFAFRPPTFYQPVTEDEIVQIVRSHQKVRLFGSGHSFNAGVQSDEALVSLDKWAGVIEKKESAPQHLTFRGGTRVRDVVRELKKRKLNFKAMPSHDAQSIGGILSTDVHGTGRDWGFVSELVVALKIIDGNGDIHECSPKDDLFKAAIGGIGAVGVISEVTVEAVEEFRVRQTFEIRELKEVMADLDQLLLKHEHLSLYIFPFTGKCQVSTWATTKDPKSKFGDLREWLAISFDALVSAWFGNLMAYTGLLKILSNAAYGIKQGTNLVLESDAAFNRTIYHLHQELEFTVPFEKTREMCEHFLDLYTDSYSSALPYALLEVRFTPPDHDRTLLGAGRERRSTWIDLICNDSIGFEKYYADAEEHIKKLGARPHLGKYCKTLDAAHMKAVHGSNFDRFIELMRLHDPERKFSNQFTRRIFGE